MFGIGASGNAARGAVTAREVERLLCNCADLMEKELQLGRGVEARVLWLDGCVDAAALSRQLLRPLALLEGRDEESCFRAAVEGGVWTGALRQRRRAEDVAADLTDGCAAVLFPRLGTALTAEIKTAAVRGVEAPTVEKSVLGAKEAFTETLRMNTALVRRRLPTPGLKLSQGVVGRETRTAVALLYIEGLAPAERVEALRARLDGLELRGVTAVGELERPLAGTPRTAFPQAVHTERPDRFALGLLRGQVGVLADGLPVGLLLPAALPEMLRVGEDASRHAPVAAALTALRWLGLGLSLLLPAMYVAAAMYHPELIPFTLLESIIRSKEAVPFSTAGEILGMLLSFELLQEAGIRLPEPVGQTVSVIGALIVGQSAVEAKVLSPIVIIVVALAGIGGYAQPSQELSAAVRLWRFFLVGLGALLGLFGVMAGLLLLLWRLCCMENLGQSYLAPLCDGSGGGARRLLARLFARARAGRGTS